MEKTDQELIAQHLEGDATALEALVNRYIKIVYSFAYRISGNSADAEDITQESFLKAWKNINKYDNSRSFKTWLLSIARNTAIDLFRKKKPYTFTEIDSFSSAEDDANFEEKIADTELLPEEVFSRKEISNEVQEALNKIPVNAKEVVILHLNEDMTFEEIAETLGEPMNTVKSRYRRALANLKVLLEGQHAPN